MTAYRCRMHPDLPVTWKGTGCERCAPSASTRSARRHWRRNSPSDIPDWSINDND